MPTDKALWFPTLGYYPSVSQIPFSQLPPQLNCLILDVDNSVAEPLHDHEVPPDTGSVLREAKAAGWISQIALVSNMVFHWPRREKRIKHIAEVVGADHIVKAYLGHLKPDPRPFIWAMEAMRSNPSNTFVVGDQCRTDIVGGNRAGLLTIKVDPLGRDPFFGTRFSRWLEQRRMQGLDYGWNMTELSRF